MQETTMQETTMQETTIQKKIFLKSNRNDVWSFLTEPDKLAIWFHRPDITFTEGAEFSMIKEDDGSCFMSGIVLEAKCPERLVYEFKIPQMGSKTSMVTWTLVDVPGGVELSLQHTGLPQGNQAFDLLLALDKGWEEHMAKIREHIALSDAA